MTALDPQHRGRKHAAIIYHPVKAPLDRLRDAVAAQEDRQGWARARWYETDSGDGGLSAAAEALAEDPAVVVVVGGDGTVRAVAEALCGTGVALAVIPVGTGNLFARDLGVPLDDISACAAIAFSGEDRAVDVGVAELEEESGARSARVFVAMAGIGLDAEMAENTSAIAKKHLGWLAYVTPIARSIVANRLFRFDYRVDEGRVRSAHAHTVLVGNCGTLTGNMLLIPDAVIDDGLLDVVMMRPKGWFGWARIGTRLTLQGIARRSRLSQRLLQRAPSIRELAYVQGRRFEARFETAHLIELDGDSFGRVLRVRISVHAGALLSRISGTRPEAADRC